MNKPNEINEKHSNITLNSDFCLGIVECVKRCQQALVQVLYFEEIPRKEANKPLRYNVALSDGYCYFRAAFCHDASRKIRDNHLTKYDIILVTKYLVSQLTSQSATLVMITDYERRISGVKRIIGKPVYISDYKTAKCKNPFGANTISYEELFECPKKTDITSQLYSQFIKSTPLEITNTSIHAGTPQKHTASQSDIDKTKKKVNSMRFYNNDDKNQGADNESTPNEKLMFLHKSQEEENTKQTPNNKDDRAHISTSQRNRMISEQIDLNIPREEEKKDAGSSTTRQIKIYTFAKQSDESSKRSPSSGKSSKEKPISILALDSQTSSGPRSKPGSAKKGNRIEDIDLSKLNLNDESNTSKGDLTLIIEIDEDEGSPEIIETEPPMRETSKEKKTVNKEQEVIRKKEAIKAQEPVETKKRIVEKKQPEVEVIEIEDFDEDQDDIMEIMMYKILSAAKPKEIEFGPKQSLFHREPTKEKSGSPLPPFVQQRRHKQQSNTPEKGQSNAVQLPAQNLIFAVPKPVIKAQTVQKENRNVFYWDFHLDKAQAPPPPTLQQQQQNKITISEPPPKSVVQHQQQQHQQQNPTSSLKQQQKNIPGTPEPQKPPVQQQQQGTAEAPKPTENNGKDSFRRPSPFKLLPTIQVQPPTVESKPQNEVHEMLLSYRKEQKKDPTLMLPPALSSGSKSRNSLQTESDAQSQMIIPISSLTYLSNNWVIKARVVQKSLLKTLQTKSGRPTTMFTIEIIDKDEGEIEVVFFGRACKSHFDMIHEGRVYLFSGGLIKNAAIQQTATVNDFQIIYESRGDILEIPDDGTIPINLFKFSSIFEIQYKEVGEVIDFVGIIKEVGEMSEVDSRSGEKIPKRNFFVYDKSCQPIEVTLWGDHCSVPLTTDGMVVIKKVRVQQYLGRKCLVSSPKTMVITRDFPTQVKEISEIAKLLEKKTAKFEVEKKYDPKYLISEILDGQSTLKKTEKHYFDVTASIIHIQNDLMSTLYYLSCTKEHCMKKVVPLDTTHWKCLNCREITSHPKPRYTLSMLIADLSGSMWVNAFDSIGEHIIKQPASYIKLLRESEKEDDFEEFQRIMRTPILKEYNLRLLVKYEEFKGREEWKCSIVKITPLSYVDESKRTLQMLYQY